MRLVPRWLGVWWKQSRCDHQWGIDFTVKWRFHRKGPRKGERIWPGKIIKVDEKCQLCGKPTP